VMASHGRTGLNKLLLGSQTARVLALTTTAVLVYR
ncbi:MAG TPA: universal stress protein, partial [Beijerinckiaceae bacterium]